MRISLFYKLLSFFSLFIFVIIAFFVGYSLEETKKIVTDQAHRDLAAIAEGTEGQIFMFFENQKTRIVNWSSDGTIREKFETIIRGEKDGSEIESLIAYINTHKQSTAPDILITDLFDMNGVGKNAPGEQSCAGTAHPRAHRRA